VSRPAVAFATGLALALALCPWRAGALEPRFDHRDQSGLLVSLEGWRETVAVSGRPTVTELHPRLRLGWSHEVSGEGDELIFAAAVRADGFGDPSRDRYLLGLDARYRGYFGTEELKTFFEIGVASEVRNRFAIGPLFGLGLAYDPSRSWGFFASAAFAAGLGDARIAGFGGAAGLQLRFE